MSISQQIELYETFSQQILHAIESEDDEEISRVDPLLSNAFSTIIAMSPEDKKSQSEQIEYLLGQLLPLKERTKMQQEICKKLLEI